MADTAIASTYFPRALARRRPEDYVAPVVISGLGVLLRVALGPLTIDDAYITFRYARNLADGLGFVYNPGQHVLGTTTPLWTLILAATYALGAHDLPEVALILGALLDAGSILILIDLARRLDLGRFWSWALGVLWAISAPSMAFTNGGMETPLFICLVLLAAWADLKGQACWAGLAAGAATLARPEGLLVAGLVVGHHLLYRRFPPWRAVAGMAITVLPWIAFAALYFGNPLTNSVQAKAIAYQGHVDPWSGPILVLGQLGIPAFSIFQIELGAVGFSVGPLSACALLLVSLVFLPRLVRFVRGRPEAVPLVLFAPLLAGIYMLAPALRGLPLFPWYLVPLVPFYLLALLSLARAVSRRWKRGPQAIIAIALLFWAAMAFNFGRRSFVNYFAPVNAVLVREQAYLASARWLAPRLTPDTVVALPEIGAFGYASNVRVLDIVGLVSPEVTHYYPLPVEEIGGSIPSALIQDARPEYIVVLDVFLDRSLSDAPWFQNDYRLLATIPAVYPDWNTQCVYVFGRTE